MRMGLARACCVLGLVVVLGVLGCEGGSGRPAPVPYPDAGGNCVDEDGDGYDAVGSCTGGDDCDDGNDAIHPEAVDTSCADLNCDGVGGPDIDADGHADEECGGDDCDDAHAERHPGLPDTLGNEIDDDCDGVDGVDADGDGVASEASGGTDCDDADRDVSPVAVDLYGDGEDADCDGGDGIDADADEFASDATGGPDCDDGDPEIHPGAPDPFGSEVDENCDGVNGVDADADGYADAGTGGTDCNDGDALVHPFAQGDWLWEVLSTVFRGDPPSAALDSNGAVHVAFVEEDDFGTNQLVVADDASGAWHFEPIAPSPYCVALALDGDDAVHLVYRTALEDPQYATNASGAWVIEPIGGFAGIANCTVGVAPNGVVHTVFSTAALAVRHGYRGQDDWFTEQVATGEVLTTDVSLQIDGRSILHIAYSDNRGVHYVSNATAGYAETGEAQAGPGGAGPFALADGDTLIVSIDGGPAQTVTFETADFVNIAAATAAELDAAITAQLTGALVTTANATVRITSASVGTGSVVDIDGDSTAIVGDKLDMRSGAGGTHLGGVWIEESVAPGQMARLALLGDVPAVVYQGVPRLSYAERVGPDDWAAYDLGSDATSPDLTFKADGERHTVFGDPDTGHVVWARSDSGAVWSSQVVPPVAGLETIGRILMDGNEPIFFVVETIDDETSLYVVRQGVEDDVDQDCDGRVW